jgi:hypothetical protein
MESKLREAIVGGFDPGQLTQTLGEGSPSHQFDALVSQSATYEQQVFQLVDRADKEG